MPMWTYDPNWDAIREFFAKFESLIPEGYSGRLGIRMHRTGHPISLEMFGSDFPASPLAPMVVLELVDGEVSPGWDSLIEKYEVPWAREDDFHHFRDRVMEHYHFEDLAESTAEAIAAEATPGADLLTKAFFDRRGE